MPLSFQLETARSGYCIPAVFQARSKTPSDDKDYNPGHIPFDDENNITLEEQALPPRHVRMKLRLRFKDKDKPKDFQMRLEDVALRHNVPRQEFEEEFSSFRISITLGFQTALSTPFKLLGKQDRKNNALLPSRQEKAKNRTVDSTPTKKRKSEKKPSTPPRTELELESAKHEALHFKTENENLKLQLKKQKVAMQEEIEKLRSELRQKRNTPVRPSIREKELELKSLDLESENTKLLRDFQRLLEEQKESQEKIRNLEATALVQKEEISKLHKELMDPVPTSFPETENEKLRNQLNEMKKICSDYQETQVELEENNEHLEQQLQTTITQHDLQSKELKDLKDYSQKAELLIKEKDLRIGELESQREHEVEETNRLDLLLKSQDEQINSLNQTINELRETELSLRHELAEKKSNIWDFLETMKGAAVGLGLCDQDTFYSQPEELYEDHDEPVQVQDDAADSDSESGYVSLGDSPSAKEPRNVLFDCNVNPMLKSQLDESIYRHSKRETADFDILVVNMANPSYSLALLKAIATNVTIVNQDWLKDENRFQNPEKFKIEQFSDFLKLNQKLQGKTIHYSGNEEKNFWIPIFEGLGMEVVFGASHGEYWFTTSGISSHSGIKKYNPATFTKMFFQL